MGLDSPPTPPRAWFWVFLLGVLTLLGLSLFSEVMPPYKRLYGDVTLDNVLHFVAFGMLGLVAPMAFRTRSRGLAALLMLLLLGFSLEFWQNYLPGRRCQLLDAAANALGLGVGGLFGFALRGRWKRKATRKFT